MACSSGIRVHNLSCGDTISYSLPILVGELTPPLPQGFITANNNSITPPISSQSSISWPVCNGQFKVLVPLKPGENKITLSACEHRQDFILQYKVPANKHFVRPVLIKCCDDEGSIQGPPEEDCSSDSARRRISLGSKLLQTFCAEKMQEHGLGRKTFVLEHDLDGTNPECHLFTSKLKVAEAHAMTGGDLWLHFAKELMSSKLFRNKDHCKWFAFMSFTRYEAPKEGIPKSHSDILRSTKGHTALGGGGLALFGSGNMHTWAQSLQEVIPRFTDTRKMDRTLYMDDSAYREYYWANFSTGLGASLHELGHTFDLAHTPTGVMARGFDDLYRFFLVQPLGGRGSVDGSRVASPIPYSPRQSPIHRPKVGSNSRSSSPKACPLSRPRLRSSSPGVTAPDTLSPTPHPSVIQVEPAFHKLHIQSTQTVVLRNYDGSETRRTITRHRDSIETVTEVTMHGDGERVIKEVIRHLATGKSRTTMSMSTSHNPDAPSTLSLHGSMSSSNASSIHSNHSPSSLPPSPDQEKTGIVEGTGQQKVGEVSGHTSPAFQELRYKDGGAHWYRSSAVLLSFHKWFNDPRPDDPKKAPILDGCMLRSATGLRLVELRSLPDGVVLHHWEFLHGRPPTRFRLRHTEISRFCSPEATEVGVLAEEEYGNIFKKKLPLSVLREAENAESPSSGTADKLLSLSLPQK